MQKTKPIKKLFNLRLLFLIVIILTLLLLILFPWKTAKYMDQQDTSVLKEQFSSRLKTKFHQALKYPQNNEHILQLASVMNEKSMWQESTELLTRKIEQSVLSQQQAKRYDLILLHNYIGDYHTSSSLIKDNSTLKTNVRKQLQKLESYTNFTLSEQQTLAENSADFGLLPLAVKQYYQLAQNDSTYRSQWYAEAGQWANKAEDFIQAADAFKLAGEGLQQSSNFNQYTDDWLNASIKANQIEKVQPFLEKIKQHPPKSLKKIEKLANISSQAELYSTASQFFAYLAEQDVATQTQRWYEKASYWSTKAKNYTMAANYLLHAKKITHDSSDQWVIQQRLIDIYIKGKEPKQALTILLPLIKEAPDNHKLSDQAIYIALESGDITLARQLNTPYLQTLPPSLHALNNQVDIETKDKKYAQAIQYLKKIINITPNALKPRQQWAELEAQEGNYQLALELWQWIYSVSHQTKHLQKVIQLAQLNLPKEGVTTLKQIAQQYELPKQAVYDVFFYLVNADKKESAEQFLNEYLAIHQTEKELLETLAKWYGGERRYKKSLQTWNKIEKQFGQNFSTSLSRFELLWLLKRKRQAHRLWIANRKQWRKHANPSQLSVMADLAWQYKQTKTALAYYNQLLNRRYKRTSKERAFQYTRIAILNSKLGRKRKALSTYRKGFLKTRQTNLLINGLQLSFDLKDMYNFKRLTTLAKQHKRLFRSKARYWLLQAAHAQQHKQYKTALRYYKTVLSLKPRSHEARNAVRAIRKHLNSI
ncbi:MAG: tetratricopeptide repeat protein [Cocleimonas sp.]|nr:tetratricopeptide repeat protein [Cocleimonas sp.]